MIKQYTGIKHNNMKTITISADAAEKALKEATGDTRKALNTLYGDQLKPKNITDRVKSFEDACGVLGISISDILSKYDTKDEAAYKKLKVIARALNEGWEPDWKNQNQPKYLPYFEHNGTAFSHSDYYYWSTDAHVGSRLYYKSFDLAIYAGKQFIDIYNDFLSL